MNSKLTALLKFFILLVIAVGLLALAFRGISVGKIVHEILQANMFWLLLSVAISLVAFVSRAYRWNLLIESLGYSPQLKNSTYSLMVGYFANLAFPRLGEVTRCGSLSKAESIPFNILLGTVVVERVVDVISLLICLILTAIIEFNRLGKFITESLVTPIIEKFRQSVASPVVIVAVVIMGLIIFFGIRYFRNNHRQNGHESKVVHLIRDLINGLRSIGKLKRPWRFIFHSVLIWVLYFLGTYVCFFALPYTSQLGLSAALFILVVAGLGMSAPVQGGIGAYHLLVSQGLMLYGLSQQDGLACATLFHTSQIAVILLFGTVSLLLLFSGNKKRKNKLG